MPYWCVTFISTDPPGICLGGLFLRSTHIDQLGAEDLAIGAVVAAAQTSHNAKSVCVRQRDEAGSPRPQRQAVKQEREQADAPCFQESSPCFLSVICFWRNYLSP